MSPQIFEGILNNIPNPTDSTFYEMLTSILYNNIIASFIFLSSGIIVGIPPLIAVAFNGFFIGYVAFNTTQSQGIVFTLATILPHGIIEIPTIILSAAMGVGIGYQIIFRLMKREGLYQYVLKSLSVFVKRVIPLLFIAAFIETILIYSLI